MGLAAMTQTARKTIEEAAAGGSIQGVVHQIRCWKEASSFCLLTIVPDDFPHLSLTVKGVFPQPSPGACYKFDGVLERDPKWGVQFAAKGMTEILPSEVHGIERYLAHGPFPHIGPATARAMVEKWGIDTLRMLDGADAAAHLDSIHGITPARATRILEEWLTQRERSGLHTKLNSFGLTQWQIGRLVAQYGTRAADVLTEDPYQVMGVIPRFGFLTVDSIAGRVGIPRDDIRRCRAAVVHLLEEASEEGHCYLPLGADSLKEGLLGKESQTKVKLSAERIAAGLTSLCRDHEGKSRSVRYEEDVSENGGARVYLRDLYTAEHEAARKVRALAATPLPAGDDYEDVRPLDGMTLTPLQAQAAELAKTSRMLVITGGPGTGKTTVLRTILGVYRGRRCAETVEDRPLSVALAAPTGKAAQRMSEATGECAQTIHRLLGWTPNGFQANSMDPLYEDVVVIDEASMVDAVLFASLVDAIDPERTRLILVGDVDQLPSVGPGQVLHDIIASGVCPVVRLTQIMRQDAGSQIIQAAHAINAGKFRGDQVDNARSDLYWIEHEKECTPDVVADDLLRIATQDMPASGWNPVRDVQVLCPQKRGPVGTEYLNVQLQAVLNPPADTKPEVAIGKRPRKGKPGAPTTETPPTDAPDANARILRLGDKVIQTRNNYQLEVFNGEVGFVVGIDPATRQVVVDFGDLDDPDPLLRREVCFKGDALYDLHVAYALTVHKSQGSEFPVVVLPLHTTHYMMLQRRLLYTGLTRARECCVLIGTEKALHHAVRNNEESKRYTRLSALLRGCGGAS